LDTKGIISLLPHKLAIIAVEGMYPLAKKMKDNKVNGNKE